MKTKFYFVLLTFWNEGDTSLDTGILYTSYPDKEDIDQTIMNYVDEDISKKLKYFGGEYDYYEITEISENPIDIKSYLRDIKINELGL